VPPLPPSCNNTGLFLALVEAVEDSGGLWRIDFGSIGENGLWWMMEDVEDNFDTFWSVFFGIVIFACQIGQYLIPK
jgi:hypothetical protein